MTATAAISSMRSLRMGVELIPATTVPSGTPSRYASLWSASTERTASRHKGRVKSSPAAPGGSFGLGARGGDHLLPLRGLGRDDFAEILGRALDRRAAELDEALEHPRVGERGVRRRIHLVDRLARRPFRHAQPEPRGRLVARHG